MIKDQHIILDKQKNLFEQKDDTFNEMYNALKEISDFIEVQGPCQCQDCLDTN